MISRDERILFLAKNYFSLQDLLEIKNRLIGSGFIGGKFCWHAAARSILREDKKTNWERYLEHHDSFYIGSDVYYTYLVENGCWKMRLEQKKKGKLFHHRQRAAAKNTGRGFPQYDPGSV